MSDKVIKFENTYKFYRQLAEEKADQNDLLGSLTLLLASKDKSRGVMIYGDIADLYFDMGHYELSINYWFRFLNLVSKKNYSIAYNGLGTSYFYLGNVDMAGFYFNEQLAHVQDASKVYIDDNMMQYFDEVVNHKKEYKIVYPYECVDYSEAVERGKRKILQGDYAGAIEILSEVYPGSDRYADALCELELAYFFSGKLQEAVSAGRKALVYRPDCVRALCTLASIYHYCGQYEQAALCLKRAEETGSDADDDVYKLATTLCEQAKHKKALFYLEKLIGRNPYETKILFLAGIASYNTGDYSKARSYFGKILRITQVNPVALYYYRVSDEMEALGAKNAKPLAYYYRVPDEECEARIRRLRDLFRKTQRELNKKVKERETKELIDWAFSTMDVNLMTVAVAVLSRSTEKCARDYLLDVLLDASVYDEIKEEIVFQLALAQYDKSAGIVLSNFFRKIQFMSLDFSEEDRAGLFVEAYARAFTKLLISGEAAFDGLVETTRRLYYELLLSERLGGGKDASVLAAGIALTSGKKNRGIRETAQLFGADYEALKALLSLIREVEGND